MRFLSLIALAFALPAQASDETVHCVGNAVELRAALEAASGNDGYDAIHLEIGRYEADDGDAAFAYRSTQRERLRIEGGWLSVDGVRCAAKSFNARDTVLSGSHRRTVMVIDANSALMIDLRNFTLTEGRSRKDAGGLRVGNASNGLVNVRRLIVEGNHSEHGAGGVQIATNGTLFFSGNLVSRNTCARNGCAARFVGNEPEPMPGVDLSVWEAQGNGGNGIAGNTVVENRCSGRDACRSAGIVLGGTRMFVLDNDLFAFNDGADLVVATGAPSDRSLGGAMVRHSRYDRIDADPGTALHLDDNHVDVDPGFTAPADNDWHLAADSPLRQKGAQIFGEDDAYDLDGRPRQPGSRNIGVFEN